MDSFFSDADIISVYTRADALEDGALVDASDLAKEAGFKICTAITQALFARLNPGELDKANGQDFTGRLWDVLYMASLAARRNTNESRITFSVILYEVNEVTRRARQNYIELILDLGPGDNFEPVITIGFPEDY